MVPAAGSLLPVAMPGVVRPRSLPPGFQWVARPLNQAKKPVVTSLFKVPPTHPRTHPSHRPPSLPLSRPPRPFSPVERAPCALHKLVHWTQHPVALTLCWLPLVLLCLAPPLRRALGPEASSAEPSTSKYVIVAALCCGCGPSPRVARHGPCGPPCVPCPSLVLRAQARLERAPPLVRQPAPLFLGPGNP